MVKIKMNDVVIDLAFTAYLAFIVFTLISIGKVSYNFDDTFHSVNYLWASSGLSPWRMGLRDGPLGCKNVAIIFKKSVGGNCICAIFGPVTFSTILYF